MFSALFTAGVRTLATLADLVLPLDCAGCGARPDRGGVCAACLTALATTPVPARPTPAPSGLPPCVTGGEYAGVRRELILAYKERGQRGLTAPLGDALAAAVRSGWPYRGSDPLVLVPVPATAAAIRARYGDHMLALARRAAGQLRRQGFSVSVARPLRALPKADSAHLDREARAAAALHAFALRRAWEPFAHPRGSGLHATSGSGQRRRAGRAEAVHAADAGAVVLLDDVLTTGATLAAAATRLHAAGVPVTYAATIAAARLRGANGRTESYRGVVWF